MKDLTPPVFALYGRIPAALRECVTVALDVHVGAPAELTGRFDLVLPG